MKQKKKTNKQQTQNSTASLSLHIIKMWENSKHVRKQVFILCNYLVSGDVLFRLLVSSPKHTHSVFRLLIVCPEKNLHKTYLVYFRFRNEKI